MKTLAKLFILGAITVSFASCSNNGNTEASKLGKVDAESTRGVKMVDFQGSQQSLNATTDIFTLNAKTKAAANEDGTNALKGIKGRLATAENIKQVLDVKFHMEDTPVEDGLFVFGIESEDVKKLTMEMYDEEGYAMAANNVVQVNSGNNYKALKVQDLENGSYIFKLKDESGKELTRTVTINNQK
jgi:hypothetical protein